jgi:hypothetical protein
LKGTDCVCESGKYFNGKNKMCEACHYACKSCTSYRKCTKCSHETRPELSVCECKDGYYENGTSECPKCEKQCAICEKKPDNCIVCSGERIDPPSCVVPPPSAKSAKITDVPVGSAKVILCDYKCNTCEKDKDNCLTCRENRNLAKGCDCNRGYYEKAKICVECPDYCIECNGPNDCTVCEKPKLRSPPKCECIAKYYHNGSATCQPCAPQCAECEKKATNCTKCSPGRKNNLPKCDCPDG